MLIDKAIFKTSKIALSNGKHVIDIIDITQKTPSTIRCTIITK